LVYSTYLGGSGGEGVSKLVIDADGRVYLAGATESPDFPLVNPLQSQLRGMRDAFVARIAPGGTALEYSTYLGGSDIDIGGDIAIDAAHDIFITGLTQSTDFPVANALQPLYAGGHDAFVSKLDPTGSELLFSTYLGGSGEDWGIGLALDVQGTVHIAGHTDSANFPVINALQPLYAGNGDAFVSKFNPAGSALIYSTYLGGSGGEWAYGIGVDSSGRAWVSGYTGSLDFPVANALQPVYSGATDVFVAQLSADGAPLLFSTYLGGATVDQSNCLALDGADNVYVGGRSNGAFPVAGTPFQATPPGGIDGLVVKLSIGGAAPTGTPPATATPMPFVTATATPQPTPTNTATPQPTATGTATPTATATPNIHHLYLPGMFYNAVWP
jgi:hypothetical protein